jgi:hypothetical protein
MSLLPSFGLNLSPPLLRSSRHRAYVNKTFAMTPTWKPPRGQIRIVTVLLVFLLWGETWV